MTHIHIRLPLQRKRCLPIIAMNLDRVKTLADDFGARETVDIFLGGFRIPAAILNFTQAPPTRQIVCA